MEGEKVTLPEWMEKKLMMISLSETYKVPVRDVRSVYDLPYSDYVFNIIQNKAEYHMNKRLSRG